MNTDPIPVWKFLDLPDNGIELCKEIASEYQLDSRENTYWLRVGDFLNKVKFKTTDQLNTRDFDWMLKLRVIFEKDEIVLKVKSRMHK